MRGTNRNTGKAIEGIEHLRQSVRDILTTPVGSRVMRREYGSNLFRLVDSPMNKSGMVELYAAVGEALDRWEPRFRLHKIKGETLTDGHVTIDLEGEFLPSGKPVKLEGIIL